jgi:sodium/bile acid cotransporter 7
MSHHRHVPSNQRFSEVFPYRGGSTQQQQQARRKNTSIVASSVSDGEVMETHNTQITKSRNIQKWMNKNFFVLGMIGTVLFSYLFPTLGMTNGILRPELWLNQYGVSYVFLLSGLSIQLSQIKQATYNIKLNILVQSILFIIWPFCFGRPMQYLGHQLGSNHFLQISKPLWDGLLVLSCLPTTVNMCVILTSTVGGNVASALCNAVLSNLLGIVTTPILLFRFFGSDIKLPFFAMIMKLMNKVLLPVMIGQLLRARVPEVKNWYYRHEKILKRSQEVVLLGILWNAFCTAITSQLGVRFKDGIALLTFLPVVHLIALLGTFRFFSWSALKLSRSDVIAAMFCSSQKTLAFGLPIIQTIFEGNANVAIYSAPLMIIHPIQLMIGSILVPRLERYVKSQEQDNTAENGNRNNPDT